MGIPLLALLAVTVPVLSTGIVYPYFEDTALYAAIADRLFSDKLLYGDLFDHKSPGIYLLEMFRIWTFGKSPTAAFLLQNSLVIISLIICLIPWCKSQNSTQGWFAWELVALFVAGGIFGAYIFSTAVWDISSLLQVEMYQGIFIILSFSFFLRSLENHHQKLSTLVGVMIGWAMWMKPTVAPIVLVYIVSYWFWRTENRLEMIGYLLAGIVLCSIPHAAFMLWKVDCHALWWLHTQHYAAYLSTAGSDLPSIFRNMLGFISSSHQFRPVVYASLLLLALSLYGCAKGAAVIPLVAGLAVIVSSASAYLISGYGFYYQLIPLVTSVFVLFLVFEWSCYLLPRSLAMLALVAISSIVGMQLIASSKWRSEFSDVQSLVLGGMSLQNLHYRRGVEMHYYSYRDQVQMASELNEYFPDSYSFYIFGLGAVTYLNARGEVASRHLVTAFADMPKYLLAQDVRREIFQDIVLRRPDALLFRTNDQFPWLGLNNSSFDRAAHDHEMLNYLTQHYTYIRQVNPSFVFFVRADRVTQ